MAEVEINKTGQETPFYFIGESLALDLVNTEVMKRRKRQDLIAKPKDVQSWWQAARQHHPQMDDVQEERNEEDRTIYNELLMHSLKMLRKSLRAIFNALVEEQTPSREALSVVNDICQEGYIALEITSEGNLYTLYRTMDAHEGRVLLPIALSALHLIQEGERKRLHRCSNKQCILFFYDTTRSATRRWCSLGCMDRARSSERYKQTKQGTVQ